MRQQRDQVTRDIFSLVKPPSLGARGRNLRNTDQPPPPSATALDLDAVDPLHRHPRPKHSSHSLNIFLSQAIIDLVCRATGMRFPPSR